jgi:hypothetical protein
MTTSENDVRAPKRDDRVLILGAGPAGLLIAHQLRKRGFRHVRLLESTDRAGGKALTRRVEGVAHELGTCYLHPGYNLVPPLVEELGLEPAYSALGPRALSYGPSFAPKGVPFAEWVLRSSMMAQPDFDPSTMLVAIQRYIQLYEAIFPGYAHGLPPRPTDPTVNTLRFGEFLRKNDLGALVPLFMLSLTAMNYGEVDSISALYGLWWNTPVLLRSLARIGDTARSVAVLPDGFEAICTRIIERHDLAIDLRVDVRSVRRTAGEPILVEGTRDGISTRWEADFLVVASDPRQSLAYLRDATALETEIFSSLEHYWCITSLFSSSNAPLQSGLNYWPENASHPGRLICIRDSKWCLTGEAPTADRRTFIALQCAFQSERIADAELKARLRSELHEAGFEGVELHEMHPWAFFVHFDEAGLARENPWRLWDMQGQNRTWYVHASSCFESLHDLTNYQHDLLARFDL